MPKYILFDTETTGTDKEDRVIQFGSIILDNQGNIEIYDELCKSDIKIKLEAMEIHNITPDLLVNKPIATQTKFYQQLTTYNSNDNYLIAHNIKFDLGMIQKEGFVSQYNQIDTLRCAKHLYKDLPYHRLQYLRYALELYKDESKEMQKLGATIKAHDALGDVIVMKLLLSKLVNKIKEQYPDEKDIMLKLSKLSATPIIIETFKFGKHKDEKVADVVQNDRGYINWMLKNMELDEDLLYTINTLL